MQRGLRPGSSCDSNDFIILSRKGTRDADAVIVVVTLGARSSREESRGKDEGKSKKKGGFCAVSLPKQTPVVLPVQQPCASRVLKSRLVTDSLVVLSML